MNSKDKALRSSLIFLLACSRGARPTNDQFKRMADLCGIALPMKYRLSKEEFRAVDDGAVLKTLFAWSDTYCTCDEVGCESCGPRIAQRVVNDSAAAMHSDICECGDYRSQHDGACRVCNGTPVPYNNCQKFKFSRRASPEEAIHWESWQTAKHKSVQP